MTLAVPIVMIGSGKVQDKGFGGINQVMKPGSWRIGLLRPSPNST